MIAAWQTRQGLKIAVIKIQGAKRWCGAWDRP